MWNPSSPWMNCLRGTDMPGRTFTVRPPDHQQTSGGVGGLASPSTLDRKSASPFRAVKRGEAPVRRFSRFSVRKSFLTRTAGRTTCRSTSERVQSLDKVPSALCRYTGPSPKGDGFSSSVNYTIKCNTIGNKRSSYRSLV